MTDDEIRSATERAGGVWLVPADQHYAAKRAVQNGAVVGGALTLNPWHRKESYPQVEYEHSWTWTPRYGEAEVRRYKGWVDVSELDRVKQRIKDSGDEFHGLTGRKRTRKGSVGGSVAGGSLVVVALDEDRFNEWSRPGASS